MTPERTTARARRVPPPRRWTAPDEKELVHLRATLLHHVESTTLRATALDVGITPSGLSGIIYEDAQPYRPTMQKLRAWYARQAGADALTTPESAVAAVWILLQGIPGDAREDALEDLLQLLRRYHTRTGAHPTWLTELRDRLKRRRRPHGSRATAGSRGKG